MQAQKVSFAFVRTPDAASYLNASSQPGRRGSMVLRFESGGENSP